MPSYAKQISTDTLSIALARGLGLVMGLVRIKVIATHLGVELFGVYSFALSIAMLSTLLYEMGIQQILTREISRDRANTQRYVTAAFTLKLACVGVAFIGILLVIGLSDFSSEMIWAILLSFGTTILQSFVLLVTGLFQAYQRVRVVSIIIFLTEVATTVVVIALLFMGFQLYGLLVGSLAVVALALIAQLAAATRIFTLRWDLSGTFETWKSILKESYPIALSSVGVMAYLQLSSSMLGYLQGDIVVGYYGVGIKVIGVMAVIPVSLSMVIFPILSELFASKSPKLGSMVETSARFLLVISIPLSAGTILLAERLIPLLFSEAFLPGALPLKLLMIANAFAYPNYLLYAFLTSLGRQQFQFRISILLGVCLSIANLLLIPRFGVLAPSVGVIVAEVTFFAGGLLYLRRLGFRLSALRLFLHPLLAATAMGVVVWAAGSLPVFVLVLLGIVVYAGVFLLTGGLTENDKTVLALILPGNIRSILRL